MDEIATTAEALENAHDLRADGRDHAEPVPEGIRKARSPAEWAAQRAILYLKRFEEGLPEDKVVAMAFAGGPGGLLRVRGVGFHAPDIVTFSGVDRNGHPAQVIQHVTQLNLMLRAEPRPPEDDGQRIGFRLAAALQDDKTEDLET
ncbi:hypothetical protein JQC91_01640 [Jannaschia sp. Os4]|uniref:hypothetical protein n=1 Tax=Jannaschia sp. Os4 TaxID=2807617 RepID=UPI0019394575|nr:hypothetical protein [Jannaschia sp. Os4]MBM2574994.1 hypothetical protein [Jannaschia sp. Os4]